jgi:hypothetical protein
VGVFFFFFLTCPRKDRGKGIQTCNFRFIKHGSQPIELPFGDDVAIFLYNFFF